MKSLVFNTALFFLVWITGCKSTVAPTGHFEIVPQPVQVTFSGNSNLDPFMVERCFSPDGTALPVTGELLSQLKPTNDGTDAVVVFRIDSSLETGTQGYLLEISKNRITLTGKDQPGLFYGFATLHQLMEDATEQEVPLPLCRITDYPLLTYRAIQLDMKHHLEQRDYYYRLMDRLAAYKINAVIAEMEDKLAYQRQPLAGSTGALTIEEWQALSEYAMKRNIEISPLIQGLGHASFILKHDAYRSLRDDPESDWAFNPLDPGTYRVQFDLYRDALEATPYGRYLHVGGDEVHTTGRGSGRSEMELQLEWLDKVCAFAEEQGRTPIFWDDMPLKHANLYGSIYDPDLTGPVVDSIWTANEHLLLEFLDRFPKNCIYMRWNYSVPQALGNLKAMEWFRQHDLQVMGATAGQTRWVLMPQEESNMENIRSFALSSIKQGLNGLLLTLWDDDSPHFELYMRGIVAFAEYSWAGERREKAALKSAYRQREFSRSLAGEGVAFIDLLEEPVAFWNNALLLEGTDRRYLRHMKDPLGEGVIDLPDPDRPGEWSKKYADRLAQAEEMLKVHDMVAARIDSARSLARRNTYRLEVYDQVNRLAWYAPACLVALKAWDTAQDQDSKAAAQAQFMGLLDAFGTVRENLEQVYGKTRILEKPADYILDQDLHHHLANQTRSFDWLFTSELYFIEKAMQTYSLNLKK